MGLIGSRASQIHGGHLRQLIFVILGPSLGCFLNSRGVPEMTAYKVPSSAPFPIRLIHIDCTSKTPHLLPIHLRTPLLPGVLRCRSLLLLNLQFPIPAAAMTVPRPRTAITNWKIKKDLLRAECGRRGLTDTGSYRDLQAKLTVDELGLSDHLDVNQSVSANQYISKYVRKEF